MTVHVCDQCGARYESPDDSCQTRFDTLLALDHSRQEPWGSRHGSAFAAFALQHPRGRSKQALERCWTLLYRVWINGEEPQDVAQALRRVQNGAPDDGNVPSLPERARHLGAFSLTLADLGDFTAHDYPRLLEGWCRATLDAIGLPEANA